MINTDFFYRALESVLLSVLSALESEMVVMRHLIGGLLAELEDDIDRDKFKRLLHYSRRLGSFQNRAKLVSTTFVSFVPLSSVGLGLGAGSNRRSLRAGYENYAVYRGSLSEPFTDEDLAAMYLSDKKRGKPREASDHEELEVMLESFSKQVEEIVNESETTMVSTRS